MDKTAPIFPGAGFLPDPLAFCRGWNYNRRRYVLMIRSEKMSLKSLFSAKDMTLGSPWKRIMEFSIPMLLGNLA